jgi:hypothetical protein
MFEEGDGEQLLHPQKSYLYPRNVLTYVPTIDRCTHMGLGTTWKLRVSEEELSEWKQSALGQGKLLSEWIREQCNEGVHGVPEDHRVPKVRKGGEVRAGGGREPAAGGAVVQHTTGGDVCMGCEHARIKHRGFKTACQAENCLCGGFK